MMQLLVDCSLLILASRMDWDVSTLRSTKSWGRPFHAHVLMTATVILAPGREMCCAIDARLSIDPGNHERAMMLETSKIVRVKAPLLLQTRQRVRLPNV